jgi:membrane-bound serine protease (ClpP class)
MARNLEMTGLSVVLMIAGALLLVAEAHVASYGVLGVAGVLSLVGGVVLAVSASGGSVAVALAFAIPVALAAVALMVLAGRKALALRRRRPQGGSTGLIGRVGVVRRAPAPVGAVLVEGELWRARNSWMDGESALREGEHVVVEQVHGLTLAVRRAEEWEVLP